MLNEPFREGPAWPAAGGDATQSLPSTAAAHARWEFRFGIEEEFFLTQLESRRLVRALPKRFFQRGRERFGERFGHELLQSQVEVSTDICATSQDALQQLRTMRSTLGREAADFGLGLLAAGTHPNAEWREQQATERPRYEQLMADFQIVAQRNLLCGLHVHVATPEGVDRVALMNRALPWLPMFLAMSSSSPFWNRKRTGMKSYRQAAYDEWPRTGIPDRFSNERAYQAFVDLLVQSGSLESAGSIWWAIRPSHRYPTLELRIADACTDVRDSVCLADLFRCLLRALLLDPTAGAEYNEMTRLLVEENRWRAKRYGLAATFLDQATRRVVSAQDGWRRMEAWLEPHAAALGCQASLLHGRHILERGSGADAQLGWYRELREAGRSRRQALHGVVDRLIEQTIA